MRLVLRYLAFFRPYLRKVAALSALIFLGTGLSVVIPQIPKYTIDHVIPSGNAAVLMLLAAGALAFIAVFVVIDYNLLLFSYVLTQDVILDIRTRLFGHLQRLHLQFFEKTISGTLLSRVINDVNQLQEMTQAGIARLGRLFVTFCAVVAMMFILDYRLTLFVLAILPPMSFLIFKFGIRLRAAALKSSKQMAEMTGYVSEQLQGVSVIKAFTAEEREYDRFFNESSHYRDLQMSQRREMGMIQGTVEFASNTGTVLVVCIGGYFIMGSRMTLGELTAFLLYVGQIFGPVTQLVMFYGIFQRGMASVERIFELFDTKDEVPEAENPVPLPAGRGRIEFKNVTFGYKAENSVLNGVSFEVEPGTTTALVGPSGGGKTTVVKLIPRFYDPQSGCITLDGVDIRKIKIAELRGEIGLVLQESFLFSGTIRDNIAYGKAGATDADIESAAKLANAHDFIMELPDLYYTEIGERGVKLSGGQKQRIAIARAILKNPRVLVFDEATSSLDSESERLIQGAIDRLLTGRTTIVIAHRLSTIIRSDQILVIDRGEIVERGTHEELLALNGIYRHLYELQFAEERVAAAAMH
ncbi:MAG: ABC transporter ATP-binding protein [bacterium]